MNEIDPRLMRIGIEVDGRIKYYDEQFSLKATGTKYANPNQNDCDVTIANLKKETRDAIITETSPFNGNRTRKRLIVEAGRKSYGLSQIFVGDIIKSSPSQPPDITLSIKALTGDYLKGNVLARSKGGKTSLKNISQGVASDLGLSLDFQAQDKQLSNYTFTGGALKQVDKLSDSGLVNAYVDDGTLVVKDMNVPLTGRTRILNLATGMIGIPEITEHGIKVKFLLDNKTTLGGALVITSELNPAANGTYAIYKLGFEICSRDTPWYYIAEGKRLN